MEKTIRLKYALGGVALGLLTYPPGVWRWACLAIVGLMLSTFETIEYLGSESQEGRVKRKVLVDLWIELEYEWAVSRWIAEVDEIPGCLVYGDTREEAIKKVVTLVKEVLGNC